MGEMITLIFEDCEALDAKTFSNTLEIIANAQSKVGLDFRLRLNELREQMKNLN